MNCFSLFTLGLFQTPSIGISDKQGTPFLLLARQDVRKGRRHERQNSTKRIPHRENNQERTCAARSHGCMAGEAGELHAREPLQGLQPEMGHNAVAFQDKPGVGV